jgi:hypothetical protein
VAKPGKPTITKGRRKIMSANITFVRRTAVYNMPKYVQENHKQNQQAYGVISMLTDDIR